MKSTSTLSSGECECLRHQQQLQSSSSSSFLLSTSPASSSSSSSATNININTNKNNNNIALSNALGSACAGIISRILTHPLDTAKARLQAPLSNAISEKPYTGPIDVLRRTFHKEGMKGLYQGFGTVVIGGTPGTVCYLCTYEYAKEQLSKQQYNLTNNNENEFLVHFTSGMFAETIACIIYVPVDVIKERLQVQRLSPESTNSYHYKNGYDALQQIARNEGLRGIYKGYGATLASFGPFSALYFTFYEQMKLSTRQYLYNKNRKNNNSIISLNVTPSGTELEKSIVIPFHLSLLCSSTSGALASWLTSPLDLAKLQLQVQRAAHTSSSSSSVSSTTISSPPAAATNNNMISLLYSVYQTNGISGLFRGAGARVLHFTPATTITITLYETCKQWVNTILQIE